MHQMPATEESMPTSLLACRMPAYVYMLLRLDVYANTGIGAAVRITFETGVTLQGRVRVGWHTCAACWAHVRSAIDEPCAHLGARSAAVQAADVAKAALGTATLPLGFSMIAQVTPSGTWSGAHAGLASHCAARAGACPRSSTPLLHLNGACMSPAPGQLQRWQFPHHVCG